ncbi:hypothetical protein, partial [Enterobacter ludwigii]
LAIDQIAQSGLSSLSVIYYSAQLFSAGYDIPILRKYFKEVNKSRKENGIPELSKAYIKN